MDEVPGLVAQPAAAFSDTDEVVTAVSAGVSRIQDHVGACIADGIHAGIYRQVNAREIADLNFYMLRCCYARSPT